MSGITGSFPFKMLVSQRTTRANRLHLSSLESKQLGVRFSNPNIVRIDCCRSFPSASQLSVTARSGGFRPGDQRRSRETQQANSGADPALDIFSIRSASVRLIDAQQNMVGVVSKTEAIQIAEEAELDLVILSPDADPPVVKIMDYNKYRYEQQKKKRDQQKKSAASRMDMKEVKMGLGQRRARTSEIGIYSLFWFQIKQFYRNLRNHQRKGKNQKRLKCLLVYKQSWHFVSSGLQMKE
ncbi:translation initiation factor IF3-2, chloroplastic-like isoform X3 [Telopea speciosissima]|uniref:translation initiation factor IF3-2, chloroplastic-like isoform X3 n=1 Tax=Telopea speciosissima TaxID=54955 RepID=UPI001CC7F947|nr:translation initiation factor IF3-2, chloroplastic-like isoform X3 [Telopea speciosissima]